MMGTNRCNVSDFSEIAQRRLLNKVGECGIIFIVAELYKAMGDYTWSIIYPATFKLKKLQQRFNRPDPEKTLLS